MGCMSCTELQCLYKGAHSLTSILLTWDQVPRSAPLMARLSPLLNTASNKYLSSCIHWQWPCGTQVLKTLRITQVWPCEPGWRGQPASLNRGGAQCSVGTGLYERVFRKPSQPMTQHVFCTHLCLGEKGSNLFHSLRSIGCYCGHNSGGARSLPPSCVHETRSQRSHLCNRGA